METINDGIWQRRWTDDGRYRKSIAQITPLHIMHRINVWPAKFAIDFHHKTTLCSLALFDKSIVISYCKHATAYLRIHPFCIHCYWLTVAVQRTSISHQILHWNCCDRRFMHRIEVKHTHNSSPVQDDPTQSQASRGVAKLIIPIAGTLHSMKTKTLRHCVQSISFQSSKIVFIFSTQTQYITVCTQRTKKIALWNYIVVP